MSVCASTMCGRKFLSSDAISSKRLVGGVNETMCDSERTMQKFLYVHGYYD